MAVKVGDVIEVPERSYRYGEAPLRLLVTEVGERYRDNDGVWLPLRGHRLRYQGHPEKRAHRFDVLVSALPP